MCEFATTSHLSVCIAHVILSQTDQCSVVEWSCLKQGRLTVSLRLLTCSFSFVPLYFIRNEQSLTHSFIHSLKNLLRGNTYVTTSTCQSVGFESMLCERGQAARLDSLHVKASRRVVA